jgi:hypothetical protein
MEDKMTAPYKVEPNALNNEARDRLADAISTRMRMIEKAIIDSKLAIDNCIFARAVSLTDPLERVEKYLDKADKALRKAVVDFNTDSEALRRLVKLARSIKRSEEEK